MNEDIELSDHNLHDQQVDSQDNNQMDKYPELGPDAPNAALNPKSYAFVPSNWTKRIRAAGQQTKRSEALGSLLH
jgi:hypothetical protein